VDTLSATPVAPASGEQTRARYPDQQGFVERDGVRTFYEAYGDGDHTILLLPTWSLLHSRCWKAQVPYLARHFRVVTFDGRGNGKSDRPPEPEAYLEQEFADDALAVMGATGTEQAVLVSLSRGAERSLLIGAGHPERVAGMWSSRRPYRCRRPPRARGPSRRS
jgi:pimeloyl-ACP methyl ester carboxylesterase